MGGWNKGLKEKQRDPLPVHELRPHLWKILIIALNSHVIRTLILLLMIRLHTIIAERIRRNGIIVALRQNIQKAFTGLPLLQIHLAICWVHGKLRPLTADHMLPKTLQLTVLVKIGPRQTAVEPVINEKLIIN